VVLGEAGIVLGVIWDDGVSRVGISSSGAFVDMEGVQVLRIVVGVI
jgi:hypothetical protein